MPGLCHRRPGLAYDLASLDDRASHQDGRDTLVVVLGTNIGLHLLATDDGLISRMLDVDDVVREQVNEAVEIPSLSGPSVLSTNLAG